MKKILVASVAIICLIFTFIFVGCANNDDGVSFVTPPKDSEITLKNDFDVNSNVLIVYFSKTNTTENVANTIQELTGADIFEVERKEPYPDEYTPTTEVAKEEKEKNIHPILKEYLPKDVLAQYDTIILGFPIWWHTAPMPIFSFLNYYDLTGKTIYTFCTAASSPITESTADIKANAKGANVVEGRKFSRGDNSIRSWLQSINLLKD